MIPFKDDNPIERFPLVTVAIIVVNALVYIYQLALGADGQQFVMQMGLIPNEITRMVDNPPYALVPLPFTAISAMFMHGGIMHLGGNMLYLWIFGDNVEDAMGRLRFFIFYLTCGLAASALHIAIDPSSEMPMIGASGAIAGVLGAYWILFPRARVDTLVFVFIMPVPAGLVLGLWFALQVLNVGLGGGVAWFAHIGGFLAGIALILAARRRRPLGRR